MARLFRFVPIALMLVAAPAAAFERAPLPSEAPLEACPAQGPGFGRIAGTATCIRLSGRVAAGVDSGARSPSTSASDGRLSIDTRSETDSGPLRSFMRIDSGRR